MLRSHLPQQQQQLRDVGATWLDQQLVTAQSTQHLRGFGAAAQTALREREDFLIEQGLARRQGQRVVLAGSLLATLREREITQVAQAIASATGLAHSRLRDSQIFSGTYRREVRLASGRFAMLDDGKSFCLVPWRPVIEQRLGQSLSATIQGNHISWQWGRQRTPSVG